MTPAAEACAITILAGLALIVGYRLIMKAADGVISALTELTKHE